MNIISLTINKFLTLEIEDYNYNIGVGKVTQKLPSTDYDNPSGVFENYTCNYDFKDTCNCIDKNSGKCKTTKSLRIVSFVLTGLLFVTIFYKKFKLVNIVLLLTFVIINIIITDYFTTLSNCVNSEQDVNKKIEIDISFFSEYSNYCFWKLFIYILYFTLKIEKKIKI